MPSTYTHYRFGKDVFGKISSAELNQVIEEHWDLFLIGLHGPDILFYYKPLESNRVNQTGYELHEKPGRYFFEPAKKIINNTIESDAALAYVLGYLCHFALDSECHSYIEYVIQTTGLRHTEIETDFERQLMQKDGIDPARYNAASHINISNYRASIISKFYDGISSNETASALEQMQKYNQLMVPTNILKPHLMRLILLITGNYREIHGLLISRKPDKRCSESTRELEKRYEKAIDLAIRLTDNFYEYLQDKAPLSNRHDRTFGPDLQEMKLFEEVPIHV